MSRATDRGACTNSKCNWRDSSAPESQQHLPRHYLLQNRYYIGRVLGQGGFGVTYIGRDLRLDRAVAIKEFLPSEQCARSTDRITVRNLGGERAGLFRDGLEKFLAEAQNLARLGGHPNIVWITDHIQANGTAYSIMEFIPGVTLMRHLADRGGRIPPEMAKNILLHVMAGLRKAHEIGLLHRDISPDNIMIAEQGPVKLIDFGAARYHAGEASQKLSIILKHGYAPEEQYRTRGNQGPWTDVYAAAATLYRCVTGEVPPSALDRLSGDAVLRRPAAYCPQLPAAMEAAILTGLALKAESRFQTVLDFQRALLAATPPPPPPAPAAPRPAPVPANPVFRQPAPLPHPPPALQAVPPSLHWFALLALSLLTMGLFPQVWTLVQSSWIRKIDPRSRARVFLSVYVAGALLSLSILFFGSLSAALEPGATLKSFLDAVAGFSGISSTISMAAAVFFYLGVFAMRRSLVTYYNTVEPLGLKLSGAMTFLFSIFYIQYHLTRIATFKRTGVLVA